MLQHGDGGDVGFVKVGGSLVTSCVIRQYGTREPLMIRRKTRHMKYIYLSLLYIEIHTDK